MSVQNTNDRARLQAIARRVMIERDLLPDFSPEAKAELAHIIGPATASGPNIKDLRNLLWCSIDNDDSLDLDQLSVAEALPDGNTKVLVAVADVDALVAKGSAIDQHAQHNTVTVYTAAVIFPMLPVRLSTDLTSLGSGVDRLSLVVELVVSGNGSLASSDVYRALVRNQAKLAYNSTAAWLDGQGPIPAALAAVPGLDENLRLQLRAARALRQLRHENGALDFESREARPTFEGDTISDLKVERPNCAKDLIEDLMVASNGVTARYLAAKNFPAIRRVVRSPKRWDRIVEIAKQNKTDLPATPDPRALNDFLIKQKAADPVRFPDLSLAIIKLLGPGEYVLELPGQTDPLGHFGLAVADYSHSTAPNRRYPDLITHRLLKAASAGQTAPYTNVELDALAQHCTEEEDAAKKVARQVEKSAAALLLQSRIGEQFDAIVTGATDKGTWVRIFTPPVEGKLTMGYQGLDVGHRVRVQLMQTDVDRGFIDFKRIGTS